MRATRTTGDKAPSEPPWHWTLRLPARHRLGSRRVFVPSFVPRRGLKKFLVCYWRVRHNFLGYLYPNLPNSSTRTRLYRHDRISKAFDIFTIRLRYAREKLTAMEPESTCRKATYAAVIIAHFETGIRKPSFDTLRRLANALDVTTDYCSAASMIRRSPSGRSALPRHGQTHRPRSDTARIFIRRWPSVRLTKTKKASDHEPRLPLENGKAKAEQFLRERVTPRSRLIPSSSRRTWNRC